LGNFSRKFKYSKKNLGSAGTQTAGLAFGGDLPGATGATEEYDGTSWTSNPTGLNTARRYIAGCGTQTAALGFGGILLLQVLQQQPKNMMVLLGHQLIV
jgi:hypothetical protein